MILRAFGWLIGALSLLNLIDDLSPVILYGRLDRWVKAYSEFVSDVSDFLFGWIDLWWISISETESHLIIIGMIFLMTCIRVGLKPETKNMSDSPYIEIAVLVIVYFSSFVLPALILPGWGGSVGVVLFGYIIISMFFIKAPKLENEDAELVLQPPAVYRQELIGVLAVFMIAIVLNYTFFK